MTGISDPPPVGRSRGEVSIQQARHAPDVGSAAPPILRRMRANQAIRPHQRRYPGSGDPVPAAAEFALDGRHAVDATRSLVDFLVQLEEFGVCSFSR